MLPSFHDDHLTAYEVDCDRRLVRLRIKFAGGQGPSRTCTVSSSGVLAYRLAGDAFGNILFGLEALAPADLIARFGAEITEAHHNDGAASLDSLRSALASGTANAFEIESVIGLGGWIVAADAALENP